MFNINLPTFSGIRNYWNAIPQKVKDYSPYMGISLLTIWSWQNLMPQRIGRIVDRYVYPILLPVGIVSLGRAIEFINSEFQKNRQQRLDLLAEVLDLPEPLLSQREEIRKMVAEIPEQLLNQLFAKIPPHNEQHADIVAQAKKLFYPQQALKDRADIINLLAALQTQQREKLVAEFEKLTHPKIEHGLLIYSCRLKCAISAVLLPEETLSHLEDMARELIPPEVGVKTLVQFIDGTLDVRTDPPDIELNNLYCKFLTAELSYLPFEKAKVLVSLAKQLTDQTEDARQRFFDLSDFAALPLPMEELQTAVALVKEFSPERNPWNLWDCLRGLAKIPPGEPFRTFVVDLQELHKSLFKPDLPHDLPHDISAPPLSLIESLTRFPIQEERNEILSLAKEMASRTEEGKFFIPSLTRMIHCLGDIPRAERRERQERALTQFREDLPLLAERAAEFHAAQGRLLELLETPLNEPLPPLEGGIAGNLAINVHHGNRDVKTREALIKLQEYQGALKQESIQQAVREFIDYLKTTSEEPDEEKKINALRTLQHPPETPDDEPFETLLGDPMFDISGASFYGPETIARLWIFSNSYQDPVLGTDIEQERKNARTAMIRALNASVEDGVIVCNPGKVQRLVISVLQGRLPGVDVDQIQEENTPIAVQDAINLFFAKKERRQIRNREELLQTVKQFCEENQRIDKEGFLKEIQTYADAEGIL